MTRVVWRSVGSERGPFPEWLRALRTQKASGAYAVRLLDGREVLYVGESHTGKLYGTITRHFQVWARSKSFWSGLFGSDADPGHTYERGAVEVAVWVTDKRTAIARQNDLIVELKPRDNVQGVEEPSSDFDVPF